MDYHMYYAKQGKPSNLAASVRGIEVVEHTIEDAPEVLIERRIRAVAQRVRREDHTFEAELHSRVDTARRVPVLRQSDPA